MFFEVISYVVPFSILLIILCGVKEKKDVFKLFIEGVLEGLHIVYTIFPYILAITIIMGLLKDTGALTILLAPLNPILTYFHIPTEVVPLFLMRPLSGGASTSVVMDIFKTSGVDSTAGLIASIVMGASETTFYTATVLLGSVGIKKTRGILIAGLLADITIMIIGVLLVNVHFVS